MNSPFSKKKRIKFDKKLKNFKIIPKIFNQNNLCDSHKNKN